MLILIDFITTRLRDLCPVLLSLPSYESHCNDYDRLLLAVTKLLSSHPHYWTFARHAFSEKLPPFASIVGSGKKERQI
jgi:hypothetical protein